MEQQLLNLWRHIEANLRVTAFSVFGFLLLLVFVIYAMESGTPPAEPIASTGQGQPPPMAVVDPAAEVIQKELYGEKPPIESSPVAPLITNNMFDVRAIQNAIAQDQQANRRYEIALRLYNERKYREALDACNEVLAIRSAHFPAQQLKATIEAKLRETGLIRGEAPAPSAPAQATPAAAEVPAPQPGVPVPTAP